MVAGAGFAGIYAAWRLARSGSKVALVEAADKIGGNLQSRPWNGYWVDNGTHNFDIRTPIGEAFYTDILQDNILIWDDQQWACTTNKTWTNGFEMPDFSVDNPALAQRALAELKALENEPQSTQVPDRYLDWYRLNYGATLTDSIIPMLRKYTGSDPALFSADARSSLGMFSRPKLGSDAEMIELKEKSPFWDDRLGVSLMSGDRRFAGKSTNKKFAYPARHGLKGFCDAAQKRLIEMGVDIYTGHGVNAISDSGQAVRVTAGDQTFTASKLFWSLPEVVLAKILDLEVDLMSSAVPVGTCFFAFEVPANSVQGPDYLQDYSQDRLPFRYNKVGIYGEQTKSNGNTLVTAEVPSHPANIKTVITDENQSRAWQALLDTGYLKPGTIAADAMYWGHPVAYTMPKAGWRTPYEKAQQLFNDVSERIVGVEFGYRGRFNFMMFYENKLQHKLLGTT
ncbi:MAG: NAD(P)-binding protein [Pseudoruegeria sp.]